MRRNLKQLSITLAVSTLTFAFGAGVVRIQHYYNNSDISVESIKGDLEKFETPRIDEKRKSTLCEIIENMSGGKPLIKHPVESGVLNSKSCFIEPDYPKEAIENFVSGQVKVEIFVDGYGVVRSAKAVSGHQLLRKSAVETAYRTKILPHILGGAPVNAKGVLIYNFVLPE